MQSLIKTRACIIGMALLLTGANVAVADGNVPEPFRGHNPESTFSISYGDVDAILRTMVVDIGRSTREKAPEMRAKTGTRMKNKVQRLTATEGNRFYFEEFEDNEELQTMLHNVRLSLEAIPSQVPLEEFNRTEQLAYWLNLHNIALLDQLVRIYPENDLKKELNGRKSILDEKVLNVVGVPLSLNDIRHTILPANYDNDPMVMYGLYQGVIGGPNIRKRAYNGENVRRYLQDNAEEFVNSNRGTFVQNDNFEVSTMYESYSQFFPTFDADLKEHLMRFIENPERGALQAANTLRPDINDWTITDVYGSYRTIGGSFTDSKAAMMDSVVSLAPAGEGNGGGAGALGANPGGSLNLASQGGNMSFASSSIVAKTPSGSRFSPDVLIHINELKKKEFETRQMKDGTVTVEELGEVDVNQGDDEAGPEADDS